MSGRLERPVDVDKLVMARRWMGGLSEEAAVAMVGRELGLEATGRPWTLDQLKRLVALREEQRDRLIG